MYSRQKNTRSCRFCAQEGKHPPRHFPLAHQLKNGAFSQRNQLVSSVNLWTWANMSFRDGSRTCGVCCPSPAAAEAGVMIVPCNPLSAQEKSKQKPSQCASSLVCVGVGWGEQRVGEAWLQECALGKEGAIRLELLSELCSSA